MEDSFRTQMLLICTERDTWLVFLTYLTSRRCFYRVNFLCPRGQSYRKICTQILEEFAIFFFDAYAIIVCLKLDDFLGTAKERKSTCQLQKKNSQSGTRPICIFRSLRA